MWTKKHQMDGYRYSDEVLMNLSMIYGYFEQIETTSRNFNEKYLYWFTTNEPLKVCIKTKLLDYGSRLKPKQQLAMPETANLDKKINILASFLVHSQAPTSNVQKKIWVMLLLKRSLKIMACTKFMIIKKHQLLSTNRTLCFLLIMKHMPK